MAIFNLWLWQTFQHLPTLTSLTTRFRGAVAIVNGSNWSLLLETVRWATISSTLAKAMPRSLPWFYEVIRDLSKHRFSMNWTFKGNQGNYSFYAKSMEVSYRLSLQPSLGSSCRVCRFVAKHPTLISIMERKWNPQWLDYLGISSHWWNPQINHRKVKIL